jgi:hypothetical protein
VLISSSVKSLQHLDGQGGNADAKVHGPCAFCRIGGCEGLAQGLLGRVSMARWGCGKSSIVIAVLWLLGLGACATDPARARLKQGNYLEAAELCSERDTADRACAEAHRQVVELRLANLDRLRREGRRPSELVSLAELDQILRLAQAQPIPADANTAHAVADAVDRARKSLQADAQGLSDRPLAAEAYWAAHAPFLQREPLRAALQAGQTEGRKSGERACTLLSVGAGEPGPYWSALVHRYCAHFGANQKGSAPSQATFDVAFPSSSLAPEQQAIVRRSLQRALARTPWSTSLSPTTLKSTVTGEYASTQSDQVVVLHGSYSDHHLAYPMVPFAGHVMVVPQTVDYPYEARDHWRRYEVNLTVQTTLPDQAQSLLRRLRTGESLHGREHNVTFEPAGIHPVHTSIPTADKWLALEFDAFAETLRQTLDASWVQTYCSARAYSTEAASRCFLAGQTSEPVLAAIAEAIGDDSQAVARLLPDTKKATASR